MLITHELTIDLHTRSILPPIPAVQYDSCTRAVKITLTDAGSAWSVPSGVKAAVAYRKPDGTSGLYDKLPDKTAATTISGSTVTAIFAPQMLTVFGCVDATVVLYQGSQQLATFPFEVQVARANGSGWQQFDWMVRQLIIDLFCVVFATTDSQSIFLGRTTGFSAAATVGGTWDIPTPCGWNLSTMQNKFFGIEDIFGNVYDWVDGIVFSGSTIYSTKTPSLFSDSTSNMVSSGTRATSDGYVSKLSYSANQKFLNYPSVAAGSASTYYCDYEWYNSSGTVLYVGGGWSYGSNAGLWCANGDISASRSYSNIGGRLTYRPL